MVALTSLPLFIAACQPVRRAAHRLASGVLSWRGLATALVFVVLVAGCDRFSYQADDLSAAQEAASQQDWPQAARLLQRYLREEDDFEKRWVAWALLVTSSQNMGETPWTIDYLETMLQEYGTDDNRAAYVLRRLGDSYEQLGQLDRASTAWLHLMDVDELAPNEAAMLYRRMGLFHQRDQEFGLAEDMFDMCVENAATPGLMSECLYFLADVYSIQNKLDNALTQIDKVLAIKDAPSDVLGRAYLLQGDAFEQQGLIGQAIQSFQLAVNIHPNPPVAQSRLDFLLKKQ